MIALVLVLAPFVDAFWARDLGSLQRELVENPSAEHRLLFDDLLRLTTCNKLEKVGEADPLRALVRVEEDGPALLRLPLTLQRDGAAEVNHVVRGHLDGAAQDRVVGNRLVYADAINL